LLVYGLDVVTTVFFRIIRKENIFEAHRTHFYQFLANEKKIPHLIVAAYYGLVQLAVNLCLIYLPFNKMSYIVIILIITGTFFAIVRLTIQGSRKLIGDRHTDLTER